MTKGKPDCYYCKGRGIILEENSEVEREIAACDCLIDPEYIDFEDMIDSLCEKDFVHDPL